MPCVGPRSDWAGTHAACVQTDVSTRAHGATHRSPGPLFKQPRRQGGLAARIDVDGCVHTGQRDTPATASGCRRHTRCRHTCWRSRRGFQTASMPRRGNCGQDGARHEHDKKLLGRPILASISLLVLDNPQPVLLLPASTRLLRFGRSPWDAAETSPARTRMISTARWIWLMAHTKSTAKQDWR